MQRARTKYNNYSTKGPNTLGAILDRMWSVLQPDIFTVSDSRQHFWCSCLCFAVVFADFNTALGTHGVS